MGFDPVSYAMGAKAGGGGGGGVTVEPLSVTENGTYTAPGKAFSPVTVKNPLETLTSLTDAFRGVSVLLSDPAVKFVEFYAPNCTNIRNAFGFDDASVATGLHIKVTVGTLTRMDSAFMPYTSVGSNRRVRFQKITLFADTTQMTHAGSAFQNQDLLEEIDGSPLAVPTNCQVSNMFQLCPALQQVRFAQSGIYESLAFTQSSLLTDATLISIANGLNSAVSSKSITLHSTPKTRCGQIVGTVTDGVFTQDDTGSVTLTDFITTTKGWTLA